MAVSFRRIPIPQDRVFRTVADPTTYPDWLVGGGDIRSVDPDWPVVGSSFRHRVGLIEPLKVADSSTVLAIEAPATLVLRVRARPFLDAEVTFGLEPTAPADTLVTIEEHPVGPHRWIAPVIDPALRWRNDRSLALLADLLLTGRSHRLPG